MILASLRSSRAESPSGYGPAPRFRRLGSRSTAGRFTAPVTLERCSPPATTIGQLARGTTCFSGASCWWSASYCWRSDGTWSPGSSSPSWVARCCSQGGSSSGRAKTGLGSGRDRWCPEMDRCTDARAHRNSDATERASTLTERRRSRERRVRTSRRCWLDDRLPGGHLNPDTK